MGDTTTVMTMRDGLLGVVAILAVVFFVVGSIQAFKVKRFDNAQPRRGSTPRASGGVALRHKQSTRKLLTTPEAVALHTLGRSRAAGGSMSHPGHSAAAKRPEPQVPHSVVLRASSLARWQSASRVPQRDLTGERTQSSGVVQSPPVESGHGKIVVYYADGSVIRGYSNDFCSDKPYFHIVPTVAGLSGEAIEVRVKELKAVFFVRHFGGNPAYDEWKELTEWERPPGRKVE